MIRSFEDLKQSVANAVALNIPNFSKKNLCWSRMRAIKK